METGGIAGLAAAFAAGLLFSFGPVSFASIPMIIAYVTKARSVREAVLFSGAFILAMILTHIVLGIGAALSGYQVEKLLGRHWGLVLGPALILLGLAWPGWIRLPLPWIPLRGQKVMTASGAFLLGIPFTVGICPVCSPGLWIALSASAAIGSPAYGALLLAAFAMGRILPLAIGAVSTGWLQSLRALSSWRKGFETAGGMILIAIGIYMLREYLWIH